MTDEEKKAIKEIRSFNQHNWELNNLKTKKFAKPYFDSLDTILNLIEKQSKEIEELKEDSCCMTNCVKRDKEKLFLEDKIKAKIEYNKIFNDDIHKYTTLTLEELLEKGVDI